MKADYMNRTKTAEERARLLLDELSLDEKMAQINCVFPFDKTYLDYDWIKDQVPYGIGEVSTLEMRRIKTLEEAAEWVTKVQKMVMENSPHQIPAIFHMEGLCGAFIQDTASFPAGIGRGASFDNELEEKIGKCVATQEVACGITHTLAPLLDISRDSRMGRQAETYGEDPALASAMGSSYTKGLQEVEVDGRRTQGVAKHFLAFHNSQGGIHGTHSLTTERELQEIYGRPFQAAITESSLKGIMPCYCSIDNEPASVSHKLLTGLLRDEMGFDGLCISDYGGVGNSHSVHHVGETFEDAGQMALEAGMDIEMPSPTSYNDALKKRFADGSADMVILNKAVLRVLKAKFEMGLFDNPYPLSGEELTKTVLDAAKENLSYQSAAESLVLLKNDGVLPIKAYSVKKIAVIGPHAIKPQSFFGGYTHFSMMESTYAVANSIAGVAGIENTTGEEVPTVPGTDIQLDTDDKYAEIIRCQKPQCKSLFDELKSKMPEVEFVYAQGYQVAGDDNSLLEEGLAAASNADVIILTLGGKYGTCSLASMGEGIDSTNINLPACQDEFIKKAAELGIPMAGVHLDGRPISSDIADKYLSAIIEAFAPAEGGAEAISDAILGHINPSGKMPVSTAYNAGQIPIYYNHPWGSANHQSASIGFQNYLDRPHTPRYPFGFGLSYSSFEYSKLNLKKKTLRPDEKLVFTFDITNTSDVAGTEIAQVYVSDEFASRTRPVKELAGFKRVPLAPGETKTVQFEIDMSQFAFLDKDMKWKVEKGRFKLMAGASCMDIRLEDEFEVSEDLFIEGRTRAFYAVGEIL